jgi:hypothetical protein
LRALVPAVMSWPPGFASVTHFTLAAHPVHSMGSPSLPRPRFTLHDGFWCRTFTPALHRLRLQCPRLRSRLTLGRWPLPRNPQACGVSGSHRHCVTHSGIRTSARSTSPCGLASPLAERSPTIPLPARRELEYRASGRCLSLVTLSVPAHSTSELLRTLSMMAASKPTSWLSLRAHSL